MNFKKLVERLCVQSNISKKELAEKMGVTNVSLSVLLSRNVINTNTLVKIAKTCNHKIVVNFVPRNFNSDKLSIPCPVCGCEIMVANPKDLLSFEQEDSNGIDIRSIVKKLCSVNNISQSELAIRLGKSPDTFKLFVAATSCRTGSLEDIAKVCGYRVMFDFINLSKENGAPTCPHCGYELVFVSSDNVTTLD